MLVLGIFPSKTLTSMCRGNKGMFVLGFFLLKTRKSIYKANGNKFALGFFSRKIIFLAGDRKVSET